MSQHLIHDSIPLHEIAAQENLVDSILDSIETFGGLREAIAGSIARIEAKLGVTILSSGPSIP